MGGKWQYKKQAAFEETKPNPNDDCQTPAEAAEPISRFIDPGLVCWEPAAGSRRSLVAGLRQHFRSVIDTDIIDSPPVNFFDWQPDRWDVQVTNPPYTKKYQWIKRSYELQKPFALLVPVETVAAERYRILAAQYGFEWVFLPKRINFIMPNKGTEGKGAWFPVFWLTWGLNIGRQVTLLFE